ncbi:MAG: PQQ-binding-like beta-propeller repeat protein [Phycisphaerae bacterium]
MDTRTVVGRMWRAAVLAAALAGCAALPPSVCGGAGSPEAEAQQILQAEAQQILEETGVRGGMVVHLGCDEGRLTAALGAGEAYLVHGLDRDAAAVRKARARIRAAGRYGRVSADRLAGSRLPYVDNLVNLVVVDDASGVAMDEVMRVLAPGGVACVRTGDGWKTSVKPRPEAIDDWTHYLHDPSNNAVSKDKRIAPLRRMQWIGSPRWSRHHDHMSSLSSLVSAGGRLFYIFDEGSTASVVLPSDWYLIARDAFNGTVLWKRPIADWHTQLWPLKSGPALLTRRLVAVGDEVYVTLGLKAPLSALDAVTGQTRRTYEGTEGCEEILASDARLLLVVNPNPEKTWHDYEALGAIRKATRDPKWSGDEKVVMALDARTGEQRWRRESFVSPSTLAADAKRAYFHDGEKIVAIDRKTGKTAWASDPMPVWQHMHSYFVPCLVLHEDVVLWAGGEKMIPHRGGKDTMYALSAETGKTLWSAPHAPSGYQSAEDLLVAGGLVWTGATTSGGYDGVFRGHDPHTGEIRKQFPPDVEAYWFHHRCHRGKATEDYLLMSRTGIEFLDIQKETWTLHHWVRGACLTGVMPANGLMYAPPHDCACYPEAKVFGFAALAAEDERLKAMRSAGGHEGRLEKGPAYKAEFRNPKSEIRNDAWPTYRHDATRNACTAAKVPADLKPQWTAELDGPLSAVTVAEGKCFVASVDDHALHALDADTGEAAWTFTAGGRIDSPPTIHEGRCLFGAADGSVYCLRAADGELAWRFRAAPADLRHTVFEQVESVWPVHGSVLVQDGAVCFVAGRSMFLDGGLHLYRLDPASGRVLTHRHYDDTDPETGKNLQARHQTLQMPVALSDILSSDGERMYMRSQVFDLQGKRLALGPHSGDLVLQATVQRGEEAHLFAPYGFLDGSWFHRSYWVYGRSFSGGHGGYYQAGRFAPAGRLLTADEKHVYGYGRQPQYLRWTTPLEYHLFATDKQPPELPGGAGLKRRTGRGSWIEVDKSESLNPAGTPLAVEAWVHAEKPGGVVLARGGPAHGYALFLKGGRPHFAVRAKSQAFTVGGGEKVVGRWVHLAGVLTKDRKLHLYIDGKRVAEAEAGGFVAEDPAQALEVGADLGGGEGVSDAYKSPYPFTGLIDEVRVYHGTVTAEEIAKHAESPGETAAGDADLVLRFTFEKDRARDKSGHKNHGKLGDVKTAKGTLDAAMRFTGKGQAAKPRGHFVEYHWTVEKPPVIARAMVQAAEVLFVAGPPDLVDEDKVAGANLQAEEVRQQLAAQDAAMRGEKGAILLAVSTADGKVLARHDLAAPPRWDGMAAAHGRLYLATTDGKVLCMTGK